MESFKNLVKSTPNWVLFFIMAFFIYLMGKTFGKH